MPAESTSSETTPVGSSVVEVAAEAASWFETATRGDAGKDEDRYTRVRDGAPEWVGELVHEAHGDMFPNDWRYDCIRAACESIHALEAGGDLEDVKGEFAESQVDTYNGERLAWLASHGERVGYVDWAVAEFGRNDPLTGILGDIAMGQYAEASEVYGLVFQALERISEAREASHAA